MRRSVTTNGISKSDSQGSRYHGRELTIHRFPVNRNNSQTDEYIFIKENKVLHKVLPNEILFIESNHVYINVYTTSHRFLVRSSLQHFWEMLNSDCFIRIHRGYVVNLDRIDKIGPKSLMVSDKELPVSKAYRRHLQAILGY